jgi:hypothetical protein
MGLGTAKAHILGREQQFFVSPEDTPGQFAEAATADSMNIKTTSMTPNVPRKDRSDAYMPTRDITERITGKSEHSWSLEAYYVPSGTKNVAPDCGELLRGVMGTEGVNANDVTYSLASTQSFPTFTLHRFFQDLFMEALVGCWVEELTATFAGGAEPVIKASGGAMDYAATGYSLTTDSPLAAAATTVNVTAGEGSSFHDPQSTSIYAWSVIDVGSDSPTEAITAFADAGDSTHVVVTSAAHGLQNGMVVTIAGTTNYNGTFRISSVATNTFEIVDTWVADDATGTWTTAGHIVTDRTTDALTVAPPIETQQTVGANVIPEVPTHTDAGSPIAGITGSLVWDSVTMALTAFEITIKNNVKALTDHAFVPHTDDIIPGFREITGKFTAKLRQDFIKKLLERQDRSTTGALAVVAGGAAQSGTRVEIDCGYCEMEYSEVAVPEAEEATVDFTFKALGSSGNDAMTWKHT